MHDTPSSYVTEFLNHWQCVFLFPIVWSSDMLMESCLLCSYSVCLCVCLFRWLWRRKKNSTLLLSASDVPDLFWQGWLYIYSWWERRLHQSSDFGRDRPVPMSTCSGRTAELWLSRELAVNFSRSLPAAYARLEVFNLPRLADVPAISLKCRDLGSF